MESLAGIVLTKQPELTLTQVAAFMMLSYAERVSPGTIYRDSHRKPTKAT